MALKTFTITLAWAKMITPKVRHLAFKLEAGMDLNFIPGQFFTIYFAGENKELRRSYSIATLPGQTEFVEFAVDYVEDGPGSEMLFKLEPGDTLTTSGPFGRLVLPEEHPKRYIFLATGTGIAPFRTMLPALEKLIASTDLQVIAMSGVKTREDVLYGDDFLAVAERYPNQFKFRVQYSRETLTDPKPYEYTGYVQTTFDSLNLDPDNDIVFLCGNPSMIDEAFADLKDRHFLPRRVKREKYISSN